MAVVLGMAGGSLNHGSPRRGSTASLPLGSLVSIEDEESGSSGGIE